MKSSPSALIDPTNSSVKLFNDLGQGNSYGIPYDTAWAAHHEKIFPESMVWLTRNQRSDGSWGGEVEYFHDRLISTLVSILALSKSKRSKQLEKQIERGEVYLSKNLHKAKNEEHCTIGFELLFPTLMEEVEKLGLNIPYNQDNNLRKIRETKLSLVYNDIVYNGNTTLSFSVEFLGEKFDITKARNLLNPNGSVGNSPSATAYYLLKEMHPAALSYMESVLGVNADGSVLPVYPFDVFEKVWSFYHFDTLQLPIKDQFIMHVEAIKDSWTKNGLGTTRHSVVDSDDSALAFKFLTSMGEKVDPSVFDGWEKEGFFQCFKYERDPSLSSNIHILDAIKSLEGYRNRDNAVDKITSFLESNMHRDGFWQDKWHLSPFYVTSHAVIAVHGVNDTLVEKAVDWIIKNVKPNGMWGYRNGTREETAYALWALLYYNDHVTPIDPQIMVKGLDQLAYSGKPSKLEELWIAKGLYCPINVVESIILAVLCKARKTGLLGPVGIENRQLTASIVTMDGEENGLD